MIWCELSCISAEAAWLFPPPLVLRSFLTLCVCRGSELGSPSGMRKGVEAGSGGAWGWPLLGLYICWAKYYTCLPFSVGASKFWLSSCRDICSVLSEGDCLPPSTTKLFRLCLNELKIQSHAEVMLKNTRLKVGAKGMQYTVDFGPFSPVSFNVTFFIKQTNCFFSLIVKKPLLKL